MNKKNTIKKTAAMLLGISFALGAAGCDFIVKDNAADLNQTVATVDITPTLKTNPDEKYSGKAEEVKSILGKAEISKRDLVSYFMSVGYQYVQNYGYSYEATFNMLLDALVSREIMIQYAVAYYLAESNLATDYDTFVEGQLGAFNEDDKVQKREKELLEKYSEILAFKYFLSEGDAANTEDYDRVVYNLKKSINDSLDSIEEGYIKAEEEEHAHEDPRTFPTNAGTAKDDYYDKSGTYGVYTGRNTLDSCGSYQDDKLDGSTTTTRKKAYNAFLANLQSYNLLNTSGSTEDTSNVTTLEYYYVELSSMLGQALINKYFEDMEDKITGELTQEYVEAKYAKAYANQKRAYENDSAAFESALGSISDSSFVLYGLKDFGFVYNVLIPFSAEQEVAYAEAKGLGLSEDALFNARKKILDEVRGKDLRGTWISEHEHANYYDKTSGKFFQDYIGNSDKYEELDHYLGNYAFQGTVSGEGDDFKVEAKDDLTIDQIVNDMEALISTNTEGRVTATKAVYPTEYRDTTYKVNGKVDYSKFIYRSGSLNFQTPVKNAEYFNETSDYYKAVAAVNEILFAYSTDPGSLNTYMGYAVSPYKTNFVPEFEYAAQEVVRNGVGSYVVCATDYGWHITFCTFKYTENGDVYGGYKHAEALGEENTFSKMYYESLKATAITDYTNSIQGTVLNNYNNDDSVTRYESRYKDLLNLD
ncbi:MAG: hypothetical protein IJY05_00290 [Clostridia bacterium]|nr:hypothetical protein [Clostridia bacterium]